MSNLLNNSPEREKIAALEFWKGYRENLTDRGHLSGGLPEGGEAVTCTLSRTFLVGRRTGGQKRNKEAGRAGVQGVSWWQEMGP